MKNTLAILIIFFSFRIANQAQIEKNPVALADFSVTDTVCLGNPVIIQNYSQDATTYHWNFCSGNTYYQPVAKNIGDPVSLISNAHFIAAVNDGDNYFTFITDANKGRLIRNSYGSSFVNYPLNSVNLGGFGLLDERVRGIQVKKDNAGWYAFAMNHSKLVIFDFGGSLLNTPVASAVEIPGMMIGSGLAICSEGSDWFGFCLDGSPNGTIHRIEFGNSLGNTPQFTNLGNIGNLISPTNLTMAQQNGIWYLFVTNTNINTLSKLTFSQGLTAPPVGVNLGTLAGFNNIAGISLVSDCERVHGYIVDCIPFGKLVHLIFENGLAGPVTTFATNPMGIMNNPYGISEIIRDGDSLFGFVVNNGSSTLTRLDFPVCSGASIASFSGPDPPPIYYAAPGNYNIQLIINKGTPQQSTECKNVRVVDLPTINLGPDRTACTGTQVVLDAGAGDSLYEWSTGETTRTISVASSGRYSVHVLNFSRCDAWDTIAVNIVPEIRNPVDTTICFNQPYFAQGAWRNVSGVYRDTLPASTGCDSIVETSLQVKPKPTLNLGRDTSICPGMQIILDATVSGAQSYIWQDGSRSPVYTVSQPGIYWVHLLYDECMYGDTITISNCPYKLWFPNAFSPDGNGFNDYFMPVGVSIASFKMRIYDRWGAMVFETDDINVGWDGRVKNGPAPADAYVFIADYTIAGGQGENQRETGVFTLVR
jgi:gliding motility-associated-like protein